MDAATVTWIWIGAGAALMLAELLVPGGVVVFLGLAALLVGLGRVLGWLESWMGSFTAWFMLSLLLLLTLRSLLMRFMPGDTSYQSPDEDVAAFDTVVEVVSTVRAADHTGRIRFQGSTWPATCIRGEIPGGARARLIYRENTVWVVEPAAPGTPLTAPDDEPGWY